MKDTKCFEPKILVGIDELTLVLSIEKEIREEVEETENWKTVAEKIIRKFEEKAQLETIFGERCELTENRPAGYKVAYKYGNQPFYFAVAYHPAQCRMGVLVKFSGHSWAVYCADRNMNVKKFLQAVKSESYKQRLSRIDFTIDYQNWNMTVDDIYQKLVDNRLEIRNRSERKNNSEITGYEVDGEASTFYVGSKKTGTRLFVRVYNKRAEQIEKKGFRLDEALHTKSWVRFEAVFKGDYAHQLTEIIDKVQEEDLQNLIIDKVTEKFLFYDAEKNRYTDYTVALLKKAEKSFPQLRLESPRDNNFVSSLFHLVRNAGLFSALYKGDEIWGKSTSETLLSKLHQIYTEYYEPNDDVKLWLNKHTDTLQKETLEEQFVRLKRLISVTQKQKFKESEKTEKECETVCAINIP